jgi:O-antigen/teichoic acid export membrane protein
LARALVVATLTASVVVTIAFVLLVPFYPLTPSSSPENLRALQIFVLGVPLQVALGVLGALAMTVGETSVRVLPERIVATAAQVVLLAVVLVAGLGIEAMALSYVAGIGIAAVLAILMVARILPRAAPAPNWFKCIWELYRYSYPQGLARVSGYLLMNANLFLLGYLANSFQLGLYAAASRLTLLGLLFLDAFGAMFAATAASEQNQQALKQGFQWITKWIMLTSCPLFILLAVFAPIWMTLMGPEFAVGGDVLAVLAVAQFISMSTGAIGVTLAVRGHPKIGLLNSVVGWGTSALLTAVLASTLGALGAAIAYLAAILVFLVLEVTESHVLLGFLPFGRSLLKPFALFGALTAVSLLCRSLYTWDLLTLIPLCAGLLAGYGVLLWQFALPPQDLAFFREVGANLLGRRAPAAQ